MSPFSGDEKNKKTDSNTLDTVLSIGASFDLITPAYSMARELIQGGGPVGISVSHYQTLYAQGIDINKYLKNKGIKNWGLQRRGDMMIFSADNPEQAYKIIDKLFDA